MNGDTLEVMKIIGDNHKEVMEAINKVGTEFAAHKATTTVEITTLKDQQKSDRFWHKVQTVAVLPVTATFHQIAAHYGWIK
jgi:hypothetical protein